MCADKVEQVIKLQKVEQEKIMETPQVRSQYLKIEN